MSHKSKEILVVDLDGTLLRSDMLFESFWSAFGRDWRSPFLSVAALTGGRASLKRHLATASSVEAATLPYDPKVIAFVQEWRASGGRTALVTASDRDFADAIAEHLGIFDEVHGSDGKLNLKGENKRAISGRALRIEGFRLRRRCQGRSAGLEAGRQTEGALRWDDPDIGIKWPLTSAPVLSGKDARAPLLAGFNSPFTIEG